MGMPKQDGRYVSPVYLAYILEAAQPQFVCINDQPVQGNLLMAIVFISPLWPQGSLAVCNLM
jgi:hypothetical protein